MDLTDQNLINTRANIPQKKFKKNTRTTAKRGRYGLVFYSFFNRPYRSAKAKSSVLL